jgi:hypothetical protein
MAGKIKLTISINAGRIDIDTAGKKGGNLSVRALRRAKWIKDAASVARFDLKFERYDEEDPDGVLDKRQPDWPFIEVSAKPAPAVVDDDTGTVTGADSFSGRLADDGVYKYTVTAYPAGGGPALTLDPVIIINR